MYTCDKCNENHNVSLLDINELVNNENNISDDIKSYLSKTNFQKLCKNCLSEIKQYDVLKSKYPFPNSPSQYENNVHYYIEGNYWVFTSFYHYLKGNCCKNKCRHCAYGYK